MNSTRRSFVLTGLCAAIVALTSVLCAGGPWTISYQGYLKNGTGSPVNGPVTFTFSLYSTASGAGPVWQETRSVTVNSGIYSLALGEKTPLNLSFDRQYFLGVRAGADPELQPLQPLQAVPYAFRAAQANCTPGDMLNCYSGPTETLGQGLCRSGVRTCKPDGSGFGACSGEIAPTCNGACVDVSKDVSNCGSCGTVCPTVANGTVACQGGTCGIGSCTSGYLNCDANPANGCEVNWVNDNNNCGKCGNVCGSWHFCSSGACAASVTLTASKPTSQVGYDIITGNVCPGNTGAGSYTDETMTINLTTAFNAVVPVAQQSYVDIASVTVSYSPLGGIPVTLPSVTQALAVAIPPNGTVAVPVTLFPASHKQALVTGGYAPCSGILYYFYVTVSFKGTIRSDGTPLTASPGLITATLTD